MIKCLTLHQPWATLVAIGAKEIETRSWLTHYRGPLAIAAGKSFPAKYRSLLTLSPFWQAFSQRRYTLVENKGGAYLWNLPLGSILCVCDLIDVVPITADNAPPEPERSFGLYDLSNGPRYAWHLANVRALPEPIPVSGFQRLWTPPPDVAERLERFYKETKKAAG